MCYDIPSVVGFCFSFCILFMACISYHVIMCIAFAYVFVSCIRAFSPLSVLQSGAPISSGAPLLFSCVRVSNILGMARGLPSGLGIALVDRLSSFVSFGGRLVLQWLTGHPQSPFDCPAKTPSKTSPKPTKLSSMLRSFDHDRVGENRTSFGAS